jgi:hypothetical protein
VLRNCLFPLNTRRSSLIASSEPVNIPNKMNTTGLPQYTLSTGAPSYAAEPQRNELRLEYVEFVPPVPSQSVPFKCHSDGVTVVFHGQEPNVKSPIYSQNETIKGEVQFIDNAIFSVVLKVSI